MNEPPRLNEWRITSRIGMNRNVKTIVAQIAMMILAPSRWTRFVFGTPTGATAVMPPPRCRCGGGGATSPLHAEDDDAADRQHQQHRTDHHHGHRRAERPVLADVELAVDHRPDHVARRAAEQRRRDEVAAHRDEGQQHAGSNAWPCQRHASPARRCGRDWPRGLCWLHACGGRCDRGRRTAAGS